MPFKVVEVQGTPNPNAMKFVVDGMICEGALSFFNAGSAAGYPLAERLFGIEGVRSVLILGDFVTVNKAAEAAWRPITAAVRKAISAAGPVS